MRFRQFILTSATLAVAVSTSAQKPSEIWSVELSANADFAKRLKVWEGLVKPPSINFMNDSQIICDFYDGEERGANLSVPLSEYHVLAIDASTGNFGKELTFQAFDDDSRALPTDGGGFVVFEGRNLRKYDGNFVQVLNYPTPREPVSTDRIWLVEDRLWMDLSPSGKTILLYYRQQGYDRPGRWTWLRASDFSVMKSISGPFSWLVRGSDSAAIFSDVTEKELFSESGTSLICKVCDAHFLADGSLLLVERNSYAVLTADGKQLAAGRAKIGAWELVTAARATRVASVAGGYVGRGFPIATHFDKIVAKVVVRDWNRNKVIAQIPIEESVTNPSAGLTQMALALSPDGRRLAVLLHHALTLYLLP